MKSAMPAQIKHTIANLTHLEFALNIGIVFTTNFARAGR